MPAESVVSEEEIRSILTERYRIGEVGNISSLRGGSAHCYRIQASNGQFVLKEFPPKYTVEELRSEPAITDFARRHGVPAATFTVTTEGEYVWSYRGRAFHLQEFVEGTVFPQNEAPDWLMRESAILLGRLHGALGGFPALRQGFGSGWFREWGMEQKKREYAALIGRAGELHYVEQRDRILADLRYRTEQVARVGRIQMEPNRLTWRNSHGDYHVLQFICGPNSIRAVIDFSSACALPVIWEVMRSYCQGDPRCARGEVQVASLKGYVLLYLEGGGELGRYDLQMMPYLYYLQLVRSRYGYEQYLSGVGGSVGTGERERLRKLLEFGFWRTEMCRWLEKHADSLSRELVGLAK